MLREHLRKVAAERHTAANERPVSGQRETHTFVVAVPHADRETGSVHSGFEIDPTREDGLLDEIAQAEAAREIFPDSPLKYMPPTKHMTGNVFRGYQQNAMFVLTSVATGQSIHLLGMLTEALHTPLLADRWLAIDQAKTIRSNARHLDEEIAFRPGGRIVRRAQAVLEAAIPHQARPTEPHLVTLSGGVSCWVPGSPLSARAVLEEADQALFDAKTAGRNRIYAAEPAVGSWLTSMGGAGEPNSKPVDHELLDDPDQVGVSRT